MLNKIGTRTDHVFRPTVNVRREVKNLPSFSDQFHAFHRTVYGSYLRVHWFSETSSQAPGIRISGNISREV
jgi:hypothetical protein